MTLLSNNTAIIPINSQHGVDGSSTIPSINEGYCIDLENADLSEVGVIRKRPGYCTALSDFPCKIIGETLFTRAGFNLNYDRLNYRDLSVRVRKLDANGVSYLDSKFGYQSVRGENAGYAIVEILSSLNGAYAGMIEENEVFYFTNGTEIRYRAKPVKILSSDTFIATFSNFSGGGIFPAVLTIRVYVGNSIPKFKKITNVEVVSVSPGTNNAFKVYTEEYFNTVSYCVFHPYHKTMTVSSVGSGYTILIPALNDTSRPDLVADALYFVPPIVAYTTEDNVTTSGVSIACSAVGDVTRLFFNTLPAGTYYVKGLGVDHNFPTALESFYKLSEEKDKLVACIDGNLYEEPSSFFSTTTMSVQPPIALSAQSPTKSQGVYFISYGGADSVYQVGDTVFIQRQNSVSNQLTTYLMTATAVTNLGVYVTGDVPSSISTGEVLHWRRYTNRITPTSAPNAYTGSVIYIDGVTPHRVWYANTTSMYFDSAVSLSSNSVIYVCNPWDLVETYSTKQRFDTVTSNLNKLKPSTRYSFGAYIGDDKGIVRYDGNIPYSISIPGPKVIGARSIPGTKGTFPIAVSNNNQKIGQPVKAVFTYVFYDINGIRVETENTPLSDGIIVPEAAGDGSDFAELVEYKVSYPPAVPSGYQVFVHAYVSTINTDVNVEQDFFLYKIVRIYPYTSDTSADVYTPLSVIVGDIPGTALASAPVLSSIDNPILVPPRAKHLVTAAGRLLAANLTSFPYVKFKPLKVFDSQNRFAAYLHAQLSEDNGVTLKQYFTAPLGFAASGTTQALIGSDVDATTTTIGAGDNNYPADFPTYSVKSLNYTHTDIAVSAPTVAYTNTANIFKSTVYPSFTAGTTRVVMRKGNRQVNIKGLPIKFEGEIFTTSSIGAPVTDIQYASVNYWTDPSFGTDGIPESLKDTGFAVFENIPPVSSKFLRANGSGMYVDCGINTANPELSLIIYEDAFPKASWFWDSIVAPNINPIHNKYIVIHGIGTYISLTATSGKEVLSFDEDLVWLCTYVKTGSVTLGGGGTRSYYEHKIAPYLVKGVGGITPIFEPVTISSISGGRTDDNNDLMLEIFAAVNSGTTVTSYVTSLKSFTVPPDYVTVSKAGIGGGGGVFAVGDYLTFELPASTQQLVSANFPRLTGVSWIVTASAAGSITVKSISTRAIKPGGISESVALTGGYVVNIKNMFTVGITSGVPYLTTYYTSGITGTYARGSYLLVRGYDPESVCLDLSGPTDEIYGLGANGKIRIPIPNLWITGASTSETFSIDYRKITGVMYSCFVYNTLGSDQGTAEVYPVPVPRRLSTNSEFYDLALPVYSQNRYISDNTYIQLTKRFLHLIKKSTNVPGITTTENISVGEFVTYSTDGENRYSAAFRVGAAGYWEVQGLEYRKPVTVKPVESVGYTLVGREDNRGSSLIWTDTVSASNAILGSLPSFRQDFYKELNAEDDSEITGMTPFQNAVIVAKKNSIWRVTFNEDGKISAQRIQSPTGSISGNNLPTTISYCYFMNASGVYFTDGSTTEQVFKLNRFFNENVDTSEYFLKRCAGYTDAEKKIVHLGVPYFSKYLNNTGNVNGQFDYCYNDGVFGWSCNTNIPALKFVTANREVFFINAEGGVSKIRNEDSLSKFRDGNSPVEFNLRTRYLDAEEMQKYKFLRNVLFAFGDYSTFNVETYYSIDYKSAEYPLEIYNQTGASFYKGTVIQGNTQLLKQLRETIAQRIFTISFRLYEGSVDTDFPVYRISVEGWLGNTRLVSQKGGTRT